MTYRTDDFESLGRRHGQSYGQSNGRASGVPFAELFSATDFVADGIAGLLRGAWALAWQAAAGVVRWYRINQTIRQLSALEDHQLGDIGLSRSSIERAARQAVEENG